MRTITFEVPAQHITEFVDKLLDFDFTNEIIGLTGSNEIEIEVQFEKDETEQVNELEEHLNELKEN